MASGSIRRGEAVRIGALWLYADFSILDVFYTQ